MDRQAIREVVHFHTDHFEPYQPLLSGKGGITGPAEIALLLQWLTTNSPIKLTAFFSAQTWLYNLNTSAFYTGSKANTDAEVLGLLKQHSVDTHLHIHHEPWASNAAAFEELVPLLLQQREDCVGTPKHAPWAFTHGCWSLNASDLSACQIENEIEILLRQGCVADFTFPAGRAHCNPPWKQPALVLPAVGPGSYQTPAADPVFLTQRDSVNEQEQPRQRLLIWNSEVEIECASLDLLALNARSASYVVEEWFKYSPVINNTLYIKTHAHCLSTWPSPLVSANVDKCFSLLTEECETRALPLHWLTVTEVLKKLRVF